MKKPINVPKFKNDNEEFEFWSKLDIDEYFEPSDFKRVTFPNLKPTTRSIALRIPEWLIGRVKEQANRLNIPYQTLMKQYIEQGVTPRK